ncbi:hypothetical protein Pth03_51840 [Planotetraspora thailandica]|uniref:Peptidoglycan recognition protein family domain-containing protein n=1 Tax=Planotetraspora thailandica TaxID=487172 RepID=A0A8J3XY21_9ACTN|nr:peptidoglycan recognition protein [Planotetraspora thailandica]GII56795.1 hypothetical protein Pth03_51840 [Planotetraspora thailandica]
MKRRVIVALCAAAPVLAGTVAFAIIENSTGTTATPSPPDPGQVRTLALRDVPSGQGGRPVKGIPAESTKSFSLLGVSWNDSKQKIDGTVEVRTRAAATGAWTAWAPVEANDDDLPDPGTERRLRGATAPLWVGPSNGVEVRVTGKSNTLPQGLRVELVDPGNTTKKTGVHAEGQPGADQLGDVTLAGAVSTTDTTTPTDPGAGTDPGTGTEPSAPEPSDSATPTPTASESATATPSATPSASVTPTTPSATPSTSVTPTPTPTPTAPVSTAPRPSIISRASWGANEKLVKNPPAIAPAAKVVFVHHTDGVNTYTCDQSPAIIRSIMLYHIQSEGWDDIGYNFLVDKCGKIFEGRAGGVDKAVVGAHTLGWNTGSAGIAVLGNFVSTTPPAAAVSAVARLAAWKLGLNHVDPTGKTTMTNSGVKTFFNISGHRDGFATACPGQKLYDLLPSIRTTAKQWVSPATSVSLSSISGSTKVGSTFYTKGTVTLGWASKTAAISRYEVWVDDKRVASLNASTTSRSLTLTTGSHKVQLRAVNINGSTAASTTYPVVVDKTAPTFATAPYLAIRTGTISTKGVMPVGLHWKASDNTLLRSLKITSPSSATLTTTATSWSSTAKNLSSTVWSVAAADAAGNSRTSPITRTAAVVGETSATRTGKWSTTTSSSYLSGKAFFSSSKGASATYTFTGRSVGLIVKRATNVGAFNVYVDGVKTALVDTRASSTVYRNIVWTKTWTTSAKHTVKIVVAGTSGRPTIATDGIAYIK